MASIFESPFELLTEACKGEICELDNPLEDSIASELKSVFDNIETVPVELQYTEEMVNVIEDNGRYFVEMDSLAKYMLSQNVTDIREAMDNVTQINNINMDDTYLLVENETYFSSLLEGCAKDKKKQKKLSNVTKLLKNIKNKGVKVVKKKKKSK